jgi:hypothetical protein
MRIGQRARQGRKPGFIAGDQQQRVAAAGEFLGQLLADALGRAGYHGGGRERLRHFF